MALDQTSRRRYPKPNTLTGRPVCLSRGSRAHDGRLDAPFSSRFGRRRHTVLNDSSQPPHIMGRGLKPSSIFFFSIG